MPTYRIAPYGATGWKVQERFLWLWVDVTHSVGYESFAWVAFYTKEEAKHWIDTEMAVRAARLAEDAEAARRSRTTAPEVYP